jgi:hypothetical protein
MELIFMQCHRGIPCTCWKCSPLSILTWWSWLISHAVLFIVLVHCWQQKQLKLFASPSVVHTFMIWVYSLTQPASVVWIWMLSYVHLHLSVPNYCFPRGFPPISLSHLNYSCKLINSIKPLDLWTVTIIVVYLVFNKDCSLLRCNPYLSSFVLCVSFFMFLQFIFFYWCNKLFNNLKKP